MKRVSFSGIFISGVFITLLLNFGAANAGPACPLGLCYNPANGKGSPGISSSSSVFSSFDWQSEWGGIHMNSMADGVNDPGAPARSDGKVPCDPMSYGSNSICQKMIDDGVLNSSTYKGKSSRVIDHGIKFDIKVSINNCLSKPMPNWAFNNPWDSDNTVCIPSYGLTKRYGDPHTLIYMPVFDPRSNDARTWQTSGQVGCQQQISNNCKRDIHECVQSPSNNLITDDGPGATHPLTHVFSPQERTDLGLAVGDQLPSEYYVYYKTVNNVVNDSALPPPSDSIVQNLQEMGDGANRTYSYTEVARVALSKTSPSSMIHSKPGYPKKISTDSDPNLQKLKSFKLNNIDKSSLFAHSSFIIVDPSGLYDLRLYNNATYGYNVLDGSGLVSTPNTCPVNGLVNGYSGICDPSGKAGCNLPIYAVGAQTGFNDGTAYHDYPIVWSGYVKKWSVLTKAEYLANVKDRYYEDGGPIYLVDDEVNDNPVLMLTRSEDYCENLEMSSKPIPNNGSPVVKDMTDCIQYIQYQITDLVNKESAWVDLYNPGQAPQNSKKPEFSVLRLYDLAADGKPDISKPVPGTGNDAYMSQSQGKTGYVSFLDATNATSTYTDPKTGQKHSAVSKADYSGTSASFDPDTGKYVSGPVFNSSGLEKAPGYYLGVDPKSGKINTTRGAGFGVEIGTATAVKIKKHGTVDEFACNIITYHPVSDTETEQGRFFIPTNSPQEYQAFVDAVNAGKVSGAGLTVRPCGVHFRNNTLAAAATAQPKVAGTNTWVGLQKCAELVQKPACNQTKLISARRFCELETGDLDPCESCANTADPDSALVFNKTTVGGTVLENPGLSYLSPSEKCYFRALCFNNSATGCPMAGTSGGHVFCLAADTKITMADGTEKEISKIKPGEMVKAFNSLNSRSGELTNAKIKKTAITKNQHLLKINSLKITPKHKVVLASGRAVMAKQVKVGDKILRVDGSIETVDSIDTNLEKTTVYNLVLEKKSDGYIANGLKVLSYPLLKSHEQEVEEEK